MITCHRSSSIPDGFEIHSDFDTNPPMRLLIRKADRAQCQLVFSLEGPIMKAAQVREAFEAECGVKPESVTPFEEPEL